MFCKNCGNEISQYEVCSSPVSLRVKSHHFDEKTGEQWFCFPWNENAFCKKWHHDHGFASSEMKKSNISYRKEGELLSEVILVSGKFVTNNILTIGTCDRSCCPHCGTIAPPKGGCFIATAAYDSPMAFEVEILRQFRDETLLQSKAGQIFVAIYYRISPPLAHAISKSNKIKRMVRNCILEPIVKVLRSRRRRLTLLE